MKKQNSLFLLSMFILFSFSGCKKDSGPKDINASVKNTVWTGEFNYTGKMTQLASIAFNENGDFVWYEMAGSFPGTWKIENNELSVNFPSGSGFTAGITGDNQLTNIQNFDISDWVLTKAALNNAAEDPLDNTVWKSSDLIMSFGAENKVDMKVGNPVPLDYPDISYVHIAKSTRIVNNTFQYFIVSTSNSVMKGVTQNFGDDNIYSFEVTRQ